MWLGRMTTWKMRDDAANLRTSGNLGARVEGNDEAASERYERIRRRSERLTNEVQLEAPSCSGWKMGEKQEIMDKGVR